MNLLEKMFKKAFKAPVPPYKDDDGDIVIGCGDIESQLFYEMIKDKETPDE
jgi:hypothetical protein